MKDKILFYSPRICYEIEAKENTCNIKVYMEGFETSYDSSLCCTLEDFSENTETATRFIESVSASCALPTHIPQLAEEFLSE